MAKKSTPRATRSKEGVQSTPMPLAILMADGDHPDYADGTATDVPDESTATLGLATSAPGIQPVPAPLPTPPLSPSPNLCAPVSGRYDAKASGGPFPSNQITMKVRVDVDRFYPQRRISIEVSRRFPRATAHAIAEVTSDQCLGFNRRRIEANITYREGTSSLIPGTRLIFDAWRTSGVAYNNWRLILSGGTTASKIHTLVFETPFFDSVEFEVDAVANAGVPVTTHNTGSHPTRPPALPVETLSLATIYQRAGFDVSISPNVSNIPVSGAGANGTWSDSEMHNAMVTFWSRFANRPLWAMWVLYAARHDQGRSLGGVMFDDIGPNHRQGTAIFTDSFIQDAPAGDPNPAAWRNRMVFWTAVHEMGHAFNLAHAWQKSLGQPWIQLPDEPEARSFMNYPFRVSGGQSAFFANFPFRFSNNELIFMRHAPRRFVQMGNSNWFVDHGFEAPDALEQSGEWTLVVRPNREINTYAFMEPVKLELKLTNSGDTRKTIDDHLLADGRHVTILIGREGSESRQWRPFITICHKDEGHDLKPGESIYGAHLIAASTNGWLIDEPGFYKVQAAVDVDGEVVVSNVLRLYVAPPKSEAQEKLAPDYFTEDVGRVLAFEGAPALDKANDTLREVEAKLDTAPAATHAAVALSTPLLRDYKELQAPGDRASLAIATAPAKIDQAKKEQTEALLDKPDATAQTLGHIDYFCALERLSDTLRQDGDAKTAQSILRKSVELMKKRKVLPSVIAETERKLAG